MLRRRRRVTHVVRVRDARALARSRFRSQQLFAPDASNKRASVCCARDETGTHCKQQIHPEVELLTHIAQYSAAPPPAGGKAQTSGAREGAGRSHSAGPGPIPTSRCGGLLRAAMESLVAATAAAIGSHQSLPHQGRAPHTLHRQRERGGGPGAANRERTDKKGRS